MPPEPPVVAKCVAGRACGTVADKKAGLSSCPRRRSHSGCAVARPGDASEDVVVLDARCQAPVAELPLPDVKKLPITV